MSNKFNIVKNEDFQIGEFGNLTVFIDEENEPWFYGNEIAEKLGYSIPQHAVQKFVNQSDMKIISRKSLESKALPNLDKALSINKLWKSKNDFNDKILINEPALYKLTFKSKLPSAEAFTHKVTHEVLPTIRKTGAYMTKETLAELENNPRKMAELYFKLADLQEANERKEKQNKFLMNENKELNDIVEQQNPVIQLVNAAIKRNDCLPVSTFAKVIFEKGGFSENGRNKMYKMLRDLKFIDKHNDPYQKTIQDGLMTTKLETSLVNYGKGDILKEKVVKYITVKGMKQISKYLYKECTAPLF